MREKTAAVTAFFGWLAVSRHVLWVVALTFAWLPNARAQQDQEQQGVEQGNYNIKQSIEFGGRLVSISGGTLRWYYVLGNIAQGRSRPIRRSRISLRILAELPLQSTPCRIFFTCNFTCNDSVLGVLPRT